MSYILFSWNFSLRFKYLLGSPTSYYWEYVINKDIFLNWLCNLKSDWSLVPGHFCFWSFYSLKGTGFKRKNKVNFEDFFIIFFQNILLLKEVIACYLRVMAILGYLPKLKRSQGVSFGAHFLHDFAINM